MSETTTETTSFQSGDGTELVGDVRVPAAPVGAAIVCHPHPQFGGNRFNTVVQALFDRLPAAGFATLRFDFRSDYDDGRGELIDAVAALDELERLVPGVALAATGYSFGAAMVSALDDDRITAKVLVAPPLAVMPVARGLDVATLVLTPAHDQFSPPDATEAIVSQWPNTTHETIASTDHFLNGRTAVVAERVVEYLSR